MSKSSKELFACGCSFSAKNWVITDQNRMDGYETGPHPMWPEILANKLNLKEVNQACPGMGNDYILGTSMKYILDNHENIELVAIQWSQLTRMWIYDMNFFNPSVWLNEKDRKYDRWGPDFVGFPYIFGDPWTASRACMRDVTKDSYSVVQLFKKYMREIYTLQKLCDELNVKYIFGQGFPAHEFSNWLEVNPDLDWYEIMKGFIAQPEFDTINKEKFMGWPCIPELGGYTMTTGHPDFEPESKNRINPIDNHPSAKGQHLLADQFYKKYLELYV